MANQLYNEGELFVMKNDLDAQTYEIGLYNDGSTDSLSDSATYSDITSEPSGSNYSTQTQDISAVTLDGSNNGNLTIDPVTFDVSDSSSSVDSVYIRDSASGDLIASNNIGVQDLSTKDGNLEVSNIGFSLD